MSRLALGATYPPIKWVLGFSLGVKQPGRKVNYLCLSSTEVKNECSYTSPVPVCCHVLDRENFTFKAILNVLPQIVVNKQWHHIRVLLYIEL